MTTQTTPTLPQTARHYTRISHREREDGYIATVVQFSERWRLVLCKDQIQWIIQRKESSRRGDWRGLKYLTSRESVFAACGKLELLSDPKVETTLHRLPDHVSQLAKK